MTLMEKWRDEYFESQGTTYENHVNKFIKHLLHENKADTPNNISIDDVVQSVARYVRLGKINSRSSMESHLESVKSFYDFLLVTGKSADIVEQIIYEDFKNKLVCEYSLNEGTEREIFDMEIIKEILTVLDKTLSINYSDIAEIRKKDNYINRLALRLFIKITLIAPAKKDVIYNLKFSDFDSDFRTVSVNGITINIPNSLRSNILSAIEFRKHMANKTFYSEDDILLKYIQGTNFEKTALNQWFASFLREYDIIDMPSDKYSYSLEPIMKTAIFDMVTRMANPALIAKINGTKMGSIEDTYYRDYTLIKSEITLDDAINWEICKSRYYIYI